MRNEFLKTLWLLRFEKIKKGEDEAAWRYQEILDKCLIELGADHEIIRLLSQIIREERIHAKHAEELVRICRRNHPECGELTP